MAIYFDIHEVKEQLLGHHIVFVLKKEQLYNGYDTARVGSPSNYRNFARVFIIRICKIKDDADLKPFVEFSGFTNVPEWRIRASKEAINLYLVILLEIIPE